MFGNHRLYPTGLEGEEIAGGERRQQGHRGRGQGVSLISIELKKK